MFDSTNDRDDYLLACTMASCLSIECVIYSTFPVLRIDSKYLYHGCILRNMPMDIPHYHGRFYRHAVVPM